MCVAGLTGLPDINVCPVSQGTAGSPAVSPVDERLDSVGASVFCEEKKPPPPCAFRPHPARNDDLRDEIAHMVVRQDAEIDRRYTRSPEYHNYIHAVQHDKVEVTHRRKVFEWNLEVRQLLLLACLVSYAASGFDLQLADHELRLSNQALLLSFSYFDQYMSIDETRKTQLQLVSTACMWVASKICASECPVAKAEQLEALIGIKKADIVQMERKLVRLPPLPPHSISFRAASLTAARASTNIKMCSSRCSF